MLKSQINSIINQVQYWFSQAKANKPEEVLYELPHNLRETFKQTLDKLSTPLPYQTAIQEALTSAILNWQNQPNAPNSLVFLGNPVEPIAQILKESVNIWKPQDCQLITPIDWSIRPSHPQQLTEQLRKALDPYRTAPDDPHSTESESNISHRVILIPSLEQCFLRCIQGWEGIEILRNIINQNCDYFWVVGCNQWTWTFLDAVCQNGAYFEQLEHFPALEGEQLCQWLLSVQSEAIASQMSWSEHRSYWNSLDGVASGVSSIAAHLWLQSLRIREVDLPDNNSSEQEISSAILKTSLNQADESTFVKLQLINPILPELPVLSTTDRYLLHCLLIHGGLTLPQLTLSLGEQESLIQAQLQSLLRKGIIFKQSNLIRVNPAYYPTLKTELSNNAFLIT